MFLFCQLNVLNKIAVCERDREKFEKLNVESQGVFFQEIGREVEQAFIYTTQWNIFGRKVRCFLIHSALWC